MPISPSAGSWLGLAGGSVLVVGHAMWSAHRNKTHQELLHSHVWGLGCGGWTGVNPGTNKAILFSCGLSLWSARAPRSLTGSEESEFLHGCCWIFPEFVTQKSQAEVAGKWHSVISTVNAVACVSRWGGAIFEDELPCLVSAVWLKTLVIYQWILFLLP